MPDIAVAVLGLGPPHRVPPFPRYYIIYSGEDNTERSVTNALYKLDTYHRCCVLGLGAPHPVPRRLLHDREGRHGRGHAGLFASVLLRGGNVADIAFLIPPWIWDGFCKH